ncbi:FHA domain-containing protein [Actinomyces qiguomingii]|uniref:FHA domain-containing protein n=1 Tax=Actinomyces qiguomingii TaxID=2057800 RepID=UPI001E3E4024|nr:FHA domain-containing protein [Actinomyces qiguomingii]
MTDEHGNQREAMWAEGTWTAAVTPRGVLLLPTEVPEELVVELWRLLRAPEGSLTAILDRLVMGTGGHLSRIPDFALVLTGDSGTHLALRGAPSLRIDGQSFDASSVSTWMEAFLPGSPAVTLSAPERAGAVLRPVADGVVRAALLQVGTEEDTVAASPDEAPAVEPEPVLSAVEAPAVEPEPVPSAVEAPAVEPEPVLSAVEVPAVEPEPEPAPTAVETPALEDSEPSSPTEETTDTDAPSTTQVTESSLETIAVPDANPTPLDQDSAVSAAKQDDRPGDHDGWTVADLPDDLVEELSEMLPEHTGRDLEAPAAAKTADTQVPDTEVTRMALSVICPSGHANPTNYVTCRECGAELTQPARIIPCPPLGRVRVSSGGEVVLDRPVLVGREPSAANVVELHESAPALITVPSPEQVISRNHLLIQLDEWSVLARSLSASNGTVLRRDGVSPMRMSSTEPVLLRSGDVLDLGDGQSLLLEELP